MDDLNIWHLDELSIESAKRVLRVQYSEADQGGTQLLYLFELPLEGDVILQSGYAHEESLRSKVIAKSDIPKRLINDASNWLNAQCEIAHKSGNNFLVDVLSAFGQVIDGLRKTS